MDRQVAIVGLGTTPARAVTPDASYREMIYEACVKAYDDAGLGPEDVDTFVGCAEDIHEGVSIYDEYTPDQLGGIRNPVQTITGDLLQGIAAAAMQIGTGAFDVALVEAHSKASNIIGLPRATHYATDPIWTRPLEIHPHAFAAMEATRWLERTGTTREMLAGVVAKNRRNGLRNPDAPYGSMLDIGGVAASAMAFDPLSQADFADTADGATVFILASESAAADAAGRPVWIDGTGWASDAAGTDGRAEGIASYARTACDLAYDEAGIDDPRGAFDLVEVTDQVSFKELQHLEAADLFDEGDAGEALLDGALDPGGELPVNVSGGCIGGGDLLEATGGARLAELVRQLRGEAGSRQIDGASRGLGVAWRGVPTQTGAAIVVTADGGEGTE